MCGRGGRGIEEETSTPPTPTHLTELNPTKLIRSGCSQFPVQAIASYDRGLLLVFIVSTIDDKVAAPPSSLSSTPSFMTIWRLKKRKFSHCLLSKHRYPGTFIPVNIVQFFFYYLAARE